MMHSKCNISRRRSWRFAEYWKHFVARLNDVHAFSYNYAGSEHIWVKFGELRLYCLQLFLTNYGRDPRRSGSTSATRNFVFFCPLNNARFHQLPVDQISRNLHKKTCFRVDICHFGKRENLPVRGLFPKKTSKGGWFSSTIYDFRNRFLQNRWWVSCSVWSLDDTMNEHSELSSIFCQVHHSWQLCLSPVSDIIQPLPSLPALPACPRHWSEHYILFHGWVTYYVTKVLQFPRLDMVQ